MINLRDLVKRLRGLDKRIRRLERLEGGTTNLINNSRGPLVPGDIVMVDPTLENAVTWASGYGPQAQFPLVVVIGGEHEDLVKCTKRGYGKIEVVCEGGVIVPGDAVVPSLTNGWGQGGGAATVMNLVGCALERKAVGAVESVLILV